MTTRRRRENHRPTPEIRSPHFFKIILSSIIENPKLGVPKKFVIKYEKDLGSKIFVRVLNGEEREIELMKFRGEIWLKKGWKEFADYYCLKFGDLLVFRYEGNSKFHVLIFDMSATEIEYPLDENECKFDEELDDVKMEFVDDEVHQNANKGSDAGRCTTTPQRFVQSKSKGKRRRMTASEKARALDRASVFKSRNPFFVVVMQPSYIQYNYRVSVPSSFATLYLTERSGNVNLSVSNGRVWRMTYIQERRGKIIHCGWKAFATDNDLVVGDVCIFEMTKGIAVSFKVHILRTDEDEKFHLSQAESKQFVRKNGLTTLTSQRCSSSSAPRTLKRAKKIKSE